MKTTPVSRKAQIVVQELEDEVLIYDLNSNKALHLNQTSAMVWQLCNGKNTAARISHLISVKLKTLISEDTVWLAINDLKRNNLLENGAELNDHFAGMTRREAVKKVGLASMVMLPVVSSIVVPSAAMAQSTLLGFNMACTSSAQCASMNCTTGSMLCCAPGKDPNADGSDICAAPGTCASFNTFCCSGNVVDQGVGPCGGAGTLCFCA